MYEKIFLLKDIDICLCDSQIVSNYLEFFKSLNDRIIESKKPYCSRDARGMADCLQIPFEMLSLHYDILGAGNLLILLHNSISSSIFCICLKIQ